METRADRLDLIESLQLLNDPVTRAALLQSEGEPGIGWVMSGTACSLCGCRKWGDVVEGHVGDHRTGEIIRTRDALRCMSICSLQLVLLRICMRQGAEVLLEKVLRETSR